MDLEIYGEVTIRGVRTEVLGASLAEICCNYEEINGKKMPMDRVQLSTYDLFPYSEYTMRLGDILDFLDSQGFQGFDALKELQEQLPTLVDSGFVVMSDSRLRGGQCGGNGTFRVYYYIYCGDPEYLIRLEKPFRFLFRRKLRPMYRIRA